MNLSALRMRSQHVSSQDELSSDVAALQRPDVLELVREARHDNRAVCHLAPVDQIREVARTGGPDLKKNHVIQAKII